MGNKRNRTNNEVISGFRDNDSKIMQQVYSSVYPKVNIYVLRNSGDEDQAKDIFQEAFIACWRNIKEDKLSDNSNVEAYIYAVAKNKWTDYLRSPGFRKKHSQETTSHLVLVTENPEIDESGEERETNYALLQLAMEKLGSNCKILLKLFYFERKAMDEISKELNITSASVRNQKYRCMEKLRALSLEIKNNG